jgi:hypothetical protein
VGRVAAVEILVPQQALPTVKEMFGALLPSTTFHTHPSHRVGQRLVLSPLSVLDTPRGRNALEDLLRSAPGKDGPSIIFFGPAGFALGMAVAVALARVARQAREEPFIAPHPESVRRIVLARRARAEKELVAAAAVEDGKLVVWSCEPTRFEVPVAEIPALAQMTAEVLGRFEVSQSGSRIRWPEADVDLNLDTIREFADPEVRHEHEARARKDTARYASSIRRFREERGLKQSDISGLTDRQVRRLEQGDTVPHIETLKKLAAAHAMSIDDYLKELAKRSRGSAKRPSSRGSGRQAHPR